MAKVVSASDASDRLSTLLDEVHLRDAAFVIERDGLPAAALVPVGLLDRFMTGGRSGLDISHDEESDTRLDQGRSPSSSFGTDRDRTSGRDDDGSSRLRGNPAGHLGSAPANHGEDTPERPIDRIDALRSLLAEPRGGERFEDVLERTFSNVRKQRRKQLQRGHDV